MGKKTMHKQAAMVTELFRTIDRCEYDRFPEFFAADVFYERPGYPSFRGVDKLIHFYKEERVILKGEHRVEHVVADDTCGAAWGRYVGESHAGEPIDWSGPTCTVTDS
jgi:ketosteroid isomerase-like protein